MRWVRLFLLGLASVYPLYWTAQFSLFFLPAALRAIFLREPLTLVGISFLQVTAVSGKPSATWAGFEALLFAIFLSFAVWCLRGDKFLAGGLAMVILGQAAFLPFISQLSWHAEFSYVSVIGVFLSLGIIGFGLYRIVLQIGGVDFVDRFALLSLFAVLPQAILWLAFRLHYPFFGAKSMLMLLAPVYFCAFLVSAIPVHRKRKPVGLLRSAASLGEILASSAVTCLLITAIGITSLSQAHSPQNSAKTEWQVHPS